MQFDVNEMRKPFIELGNMACVDDEFTFYYDESNNIRKLHLTNTGLNVEKACNFVLAGIIHKGKSHEADFEYLKASINLQKTAKEIKLKQIGKGTFDKILTSRRLSNFLTWILENDFYIHYFNLNVLYWSIVDIVDSIIDNLDFANKQLFIPSHMLVKSDLYKVIASDQESFLKTLREFEYPNIKEDKISGFTEFLIDFVNANSSILDNDRKYLLNKFMEGAKGSSELFFIMNEKDHILISDFFEFYLRNTFLFKNSKHIFDTETEIEAIFSKYELSDNGQVIDNYAFVDSKSMYEVQVSDVIAGLLAKYFTFISDTNVDDLKNIKSNLNDTQKNNLKLLETIIDKSDNVSHGFFTKIASEDECLKSNYFMHNQERI